MSVSLPRYNPESLKLVRGLSGCSSHFDLLFHCLLSLCIRILHNPVQITGNKRLTLLHYEVFFPLFPILAMSIEVKIRKSEPVERAIRRLKKNLDREGVIRDVRGNRYFEKKSETKRREKKVAAFNTMLRHKYDN